MAATSGPSSLNLARPSALATAVLGHDCPVSIVVKLERCRDVVVSDDPIVPLPFL